MFMDAKANVSAIISRLQTHYRKCEAPVARFERSHADTPFHTLIAAILSSRTLDGTTSAACRKLFKTVRNASDLKRVSAPRLEKLIYPVGFYKVKARQLKSLPERLERLFGGKIPDTVEGLMQLPGVGRKTASLVASRAFGRDEICVDTHVHKVGNRLGLVHTGTPLETENALKKAVPKKYWRELNRLMVAFGQTICRPVAPKCGMCPINKYCHYYRLAGYSMLNRKS